jgi:hypothetical protein
VQDRVALQEPVATQLGCDDAKWSPEVYTFYGDASAILRKIDRVPMELTRRRVFFLIAEGGNSAELRFFERSDDDRWAVYSWSGEDADLANRVAKVILDNRGVHCVGEQVKHSLKSLTIHSEGLVPAPESARAAFAHTIRAHGENHYIRATVGLLC